MKKRLGLLLATAALTLVATPAFATTVHVYPAHTAKYNYTTTQAIKLTSYVTPKFSTLANKRIYYYIDRKNSSGNYVFKTRVQGKLYKVSSYSSSTRARAYTKLAAGGTYRVLVKLMWTDSDGDLHVKKSYSYHYIKVTNLNYQGATYVSNATTAHYTYDNGHSIKITSYVTPKFHTLSNKRAYYYIYRRNSSGSYVFKKRVKATLYKSDSYSSSTRVRAYTKLTVNGRYRIRVKVMTTDSGGDLHVKKSSTYHYIKVTD